MSSSQSNASLVKYDTKIIVSTSGKGKKAARGVSTPSTDDSTSKNEDYLNSLLPPKETMEDGQLWVQYVSPSPATKMDVISLQDELDKRLMQRQARESGICPIREELYSQAFDELIRQITINCAERGFLLARVKEEIKMTIQAYQTLFESSIAFGMRKSLQSEQRTAEMHIKIEKLEEENYKLEIEIEHLSSDILDLLEKEKEAKAKGEEIHHGQCEEFVNKNNEILGMMKQVLEDLTPK
ncbi:unnamed protein product [Moneuplotes crassus]|uniref:Uncharacterized protein n=2 Tax=Euplotes crassus TaxID=5936 RepID=A0AAD2D3Y4_EUPCR|nr:unnamed protein product [Moneuplotes crassus]